MPKHIRNVCFSSLLLYTSKLDRTNPYVRDRFRSSCSPDLLNLRTLNSVLHMQPQFYFFFLNYCVIKLECLQNVSSYYYPSLQALVFRNLFHGICLQSQPSIVPISPHPSKRILLFLKVSWVLTQDSKTPYPKFQTHPPIQTDIS